MGKYLDIIDGKKQDPAERKKELDEERDRRLYRRQEQLEEKGLPWTLVISTQEKSKYVMRLRTGETLHFEKSCLVTGEKWLELMNVTGWHIPDSISNSETDGAVSTGSFEDMAVKVDDIVWILEELTLE